MRTPCSPWRASHSSALCTLPGRSARPPFVLAFRQSGGHTGKAARRRSPDPQLIRETRSTLPSLARPDSTRLDRETTNRRRLRGSTFCSCALGVRFEKTIRRHCGVFAIGGPLPLKPPMNRGLCGHLCGQGHRGANDDARKLLKRLVGPPRFELGTSSTPRKRQPTTYESSRCKQTTYTFRLCGRSAGIVRDLANCAGFCGRKI